MKIPKNYKDITGNRYGNLVVEKFSHTQAVKGQKKRSHWICKCDCGNRIILSRKILSERRDKENLSCGCIPRNSTSPNCCKRDLQEAKERCYLNILNKVKPNGECLEWEGYCEKGITPMISFLSKKMSVRRFLWIYSGKEITDESKISHSCGNNKCVNIKHLKGL